MQREYPQLLARSLMTQPGIAVISLGEAQQIARELQLTGDEIQRFVPVFIEGDYAVNTSGEAAEALIISFVDVFGLAPLIERGSPVPSAEVTA